MRILFDQGTPVPLRQFLSAHKVTLAKDLGWETVENGKLIEAAENAGFELLITTDKNLRYQQNLASRKITIIVIGRAQWPELQPHVETVVAAVNAAHPGSYIEVPIPYRRPKRSQPDPETH